MVQTASLFSQLLHEVPRNEFARLVNRHQGERHAKGFTCWAQFTAMLFCQLAHADSLREICNGLACCVGKLVHLGINRGPSKSNLSYANVHRPAAVFEDLFWTMTDRFRAQSQLGSRTHTFRFGPHSVHLRTLAGTAVDRTQPRMTHDFHHPRFHCHFTPTSASWPALLSGPLSLLCRKLDKFICLTGTTRRTHCFPVRRQGLQSGTPTGA